MKETFPTKAVLEGITLASEFISYCPLQCTQCTTNKNQLTRGINDLRQRGEAGQGGCQLPSQSMYSFINFALRFYEAIHYAIPFSISGRFLGDPCRNFSKFERSR